MYWLLPPGCWVVAEAPEPWKLQAWQQLPCSPLCGAQQLPAEQALQLQAAWQVRQLDWQQMGEAPVDSAKPQCLLFCDLDTALILCGS